MKVGTNGIYRLREILKGNSRTCQPDNGIIVWKTGAIPESDVEIWSIVLEND
jgi:hypothetical protein